MAAGSWRRARPSGVVVVLLAATLLLGGVGGIAIGRATADSRLPSSHQQSAGAGLPVVSERTLTTPHGPAGMQGELPVGFSDDKGGAISCAAVASETLIDYVQVRRTTSASMWMQTYTAGPLSAASLQKILDWNPAAYRLSPDAKPTELAPRRGAISVSELVPVGYKILSFSPAVVHVEVWLHGAGWSQGSEFPNTVVDRSADVELAWQSGDWKITSYTQPRDQTWDGPALDDPSAKGFVPWPGGQFTFVTG